MDFIFLSILFWMMVVINSVIVFLTLKYIFRKLFFAPIVLFSIDFVLSYILKPAMLFLNVGNPDLKMMTYNYDNFDLVYTYFFVTIFVILFYGTFNLVNSMIWKNLPNNLESRVLESHFSSRFHSKLDIIFILLFVFYINKPEMAAINFEGHNAFTLILVALFALFPFLVVKYTYSKNNFKLFLLLIFIVWLSIISTAKGMIFVFVLYYLLTKYLANRKPSLLFFATSLSLGFLFVIYSYEYRYVLGLGSIASDDQITSVATNLMDSKTPAELFSFGGTVILNRFESFDNLIYVTIGKGNQDILKYGSIPDLLFLLPNFLRPDNLLRAVYKFSMYVLGNTYSSANFDRLIEFKIMSYLGFFIPFLNGALFAVIPFLLKFTKRSILGYTLYLILSFQFSVGCATFSNVSIVVILFILTLVICSVKIKKIVF